MTTIERSGASVEEVIRQYRMEFKIKDWELRYDIISKPSSGFLGIGKREAKLRFYQPDLQDRICNFVEKLLAEMGIGYSHTQAKTEGKTVYIDIFGCSDPGFMIGKNGNMLETIQFLTNRVFENDRKLDRVYLDLDGYRERRENQFLRQYIPQFKHVEKSGKTVTLPLMNPADRRVIHRYIERLKHLKTLTIGEGENKRVVVFSAKMSEKEALAHSGNKPEAPEKQTEKPAKAPLKEQHKKPSEKKVLNPRPNTNKKPEPKPDLKAETDAPTPEAKPKPKKQFRRYPPRKKVDNASS